MIARSTDEGHRAAGATHVGALLPVVALCALSIAAFWSVILRPDRLPAGHDVTQTYNTELVIRRAMEHGQLPHWNPYVLSGTPFAADAQTQTLYPLSILLRALPVSQYFTWMLVIHLALAGIGTYMLCRQLGIGRFSACLAGAGFMLGGTFTPRVDAGHAILLAGWAWLPWALTFGLRSVERAQWIPHPGLPLVLAMAVLSGHSQIILYVLLTIAALYGGRLLLMALDRDRWSHIFQIMAQGTGALLLALGLSAVQFWPSLGLIPESGRAAGLSYEVASRNSIDPLHFLTLLAPEILDTIPAEPNDSVAGSHWERSMFSGTLLALLAPFGMLALGRRWPGSFFIVLGLVALALAFGRNAPFFQVHHLLFPGLRQASRVLPLFATGVCVLGAVGLDSLLHGQWARARSLGLAVVVGMLGLGAGLAAWLHAITGVPYQQMFGPLGWLGFGQGLLLIGALTLVHQPRARVLLLGLAGSLMALQLVLYGRGFIQPWRPPEYRTLQRAFESERIDRWAANCDTVIEQNDAMLLGWAGVNGYNSIYLHDYQAYTFLAMTNVVPSDAKQVSAIRLDPTRADGWPARLDLVKLMNLSHLVACDPVRHEVLEEVAGRRGQYVYRLREPLPRALVACDHEAVPDRPAAITAVRESRGDLGMRPVIVASDGLASVLASSPDCRAGASISVVAADRVDGSLVLDVLAPQGGWLLLAEPFYPERRGWLNGQQIPTYRANVAFTASFVPPGEHRFELRYDPARLVAGACATAIAVFVWLGLAWAWRRGYSRGARWS